ncbi:MAG TPA: glycosyltransferase family A protein [Gemmatimonadaceae bacterium]
MNPAISVVIPTFNSRAYLEQALNSVFEQSLRDYEVIVIDDGSTDSTPEYLGSLGDRITVIRQANKGSGAARNCGMAAARGRYIALLDHDDLWHRDKLRVQYDFMRSHPDAVGCSVPFVYSTPPGKPGFDLSIRDADGCIPDALERYAEGHLFLLSSVMMLDRSRIADLRYETDRGSIEDVALQVRLLLRGPYGIAGDAPLATYRVHESNTSNSAAHLFRGIKRLREIEGSDGFPGSTPGQRKAINRLISALARKMLVAQVAVGRRDRAFKAYLSEWMHQLRNHRIKFLCMFPFLLLLPTRLLQRFRSFRTRV